MKCLVVGSSRGIGLALTKRLLLDHSTSEVLATYRNANEELDQLADQDPRLCLAHLDVTDDTSVVAFGEMLRTRGPLHVAMHAAGILHEGQVQPEKSLHDLDRENLLRLFNVNSVGPIMVAREIFAAQKSHPLRYAALSALVGSITDNRLGGWYGYRSSKAALNQLVKTLSIEVQRTQRANIVLAIHPGTTNTRLSRPFQRNVRPDKLYSADESAERILRVLSAAKPSDSGKLFHWDGSVLPY